MLRSYGSGVRLSGLDELLTYLDRVNTVFQRGKKLRQIAFLIIRARADLEMAIEAAFGGLHSVVADLMRDLMEIEMLLRDFEGETKRIQIWLAADDAARHKEFAPVVLRTRYAKRKNVKRADLHEELDYKAHSLSLHVTTFNVPLWSRGTARSSDPFADDACFWELFEHARRFVRVADRLRKRLAPRIPDGPSPRKDLRRFEDAWRRTRQMQNLYIAVLRASREPFSDSAAQAKVRDRT